ncbi:hypothetical protein LXA47_24965 [Massilia sp. P8910]|uniref:hypothetical protein n=1 Tax=Massilia antarctica TaxID=2765360 RepID=UPI001E36B0F6|nr:hypothetical protein [Massilia antarctica]MCE3606831.1 hypothetical protein [Massilia antarctica]
MNQLTSIFVKYPRLFEGKTLGNFSEVPEGWIKFLDGFCGMIASLGSEAQFAEAFIEKISCSQKFLELEYSLSPDLPEDDIFAVGARAFAIRNRTSVACVHCGALLKIDPAPSVWPLCWRRPCRKAVAGSLKRLAP